MTDAQFILTARTFLLVAGLGGLLFTTLLWPLGRRALHAYVRLNERVAPGALQKSKFTRAFLNDRFIRVWNFSFGLLFLAVWWWLGTAGGSVFLARG